MIPSRSLAAAAVVLLLAAALLPVAASVVPYLSLEDLERQGQVVVLGEVRAVTSMLSEDGRIIVTRATVRIERALKGGPRAEVVVEVPGGTLNGTTLVASGAPRFTEGERVVLFLEAAGGRFGVAGWNQGRFTVRRDPHTGRDLVTQPGGGSLYVDAQGRPAPRDPRLAGPRVLEDFLRDIEAITARAARGRAGP
ncbi:MAG TPA: hypothetical protein VFQ07_11725 [Candidatus Polarisedimenticolia bacterium]|nr:hypothetical protein [Candidatus Polarisedimenticolia bacterium]